ncbi:hypothetical protein BJ170DRAFT_629704 [Xylariales sp. AK1849]|nr:hypothetical protein BJ170DRAFT_629704 [Xylariales sp. AK1849]
MHRSWLPIQASPSTISQSLNLAMPLPLPLKAIGPVLFTWITLRLRSSLQPHLLKQFLSVPASTSLQPSYLLACLCPLLQGCTETESREERDCHLVRELRPVKQNHTVPSSKACGNLIFVQRFPKEDDGIVWGRKEKKGGARGNGIMCIVFLGETSLCSTNLQSWECKLLILCLCTATDLAESRLRHWRHQPDPFCKPLSRHPSFLSFLA